MLRPASHLRDTDPAAPHHLLLGPDTHGVTRYAGEVAGAARAPVVRDVAQLGPGAAVHLHLTDRVGLHQVADGDDRTLSVHSNRSASIGSSRAAFWAG